MDADQAHSAKAFLAHRGRVYTWARALCGRDADAADITQEVFLRLVRERPATPSEGALRGWLRRVTTRLAIDLFRGARRPAAQTIPKGDLAPDEHALRSEEQRRVRAALGELSEMQRLVLIGKCYDGLTFRELAEELGLAIPTVKTHYLRGLEAIRREMQKDTGAP